MALKPLGRVLEEDGVPFSGAPEGGAVTRDGSIVFVDVASQQVVLFDSTGKQVRTLGQKGQGPGEFELISAVFPITDDTLAVFDRRRQSMSFIVGAKLSAATVSFRAWDFEVNSAMNIVGRFKTGEWIALQSAPRGYRSQGVRAVVDTPTVVIGYPHTKPRALFRLPPRRMVDIMDGGTSYRVVLSDFSPAVGVVCQSGVVLADTSGVTYFDTRGQTFAHFSPPVRRMDVNRIVGGREEIIKQALYTIRSSRYRLQVQEILRSWAADADSLMMNRPHIDANGNTWWLIPSSTGVAYSRIDAAGKPAGAFLAPGAAIFIGGPTFVSMGYDSTTETLAYSTHLLPRDVNAEATRVGLCSGPFRY